MKPNVFVGIPLRKHGAPIHPNALKCLEYVCAYGEDKDLYNMEVMSWGGNQVSQNSHHLVKHFLTKTEYTHFFYTGDDLTFPPDTLERLLEADKPIIAGCATWKSPPFFPNGDALAGDGSQHKALVTKDAIRKGSIAKLAAIGSGTMLIQRRVLEKMKEFWDEYYVEHGRRMPARFRGLAPMPFFPIIWRYDDGAGGHLSATDFSFCDVAGRCGFDVFMHCGVIVGHMWEKCVSVLDHFAWRDAYGMATEEPMFPTQAIKRVDYFESKEEHGVPINTGNVKSDGPTCVEGVSPAPSGDNGRLGTTNIESRNRIRDHVNPASCADTGSGDSGTPRDGEGRI